MKQLEEEFEKKQQLEDEQLATMILENHQQTVMQPEATPNDGNSEMEKQLEDKILEEANLLSLDMDSKPEITADKIEEN